MPHSYSVRHAADSSEYIRHLPILHTFQVSLLSLKYPTGYSDCNPIQPDTNGEINISSSRTLYACWAPNPAKPEDNNADVPTPPSSEDSTGGNTITVTPRELYTITYDAKTNGGKFVDGTDVRKTILAANVKIGEYKSYPVKEGYKFKEWQLNGSKFDFEQKASANITLVAVFEPLTEDEKTLKEVISELSNLTGKPVSKEQEEKIINTIVNDNIPKNIDKMF